MLCLPSSVPKQLTSELVSLSRDCVWVNNTLSLVMSDSLVLTYSREELDAVDKRIYSVIKEAQREARLYVKNELRERLELSLKYWSAPPPTFCKVPIANILSIKSGDDGAGRYMLTNFARYDLFETSDNVEYAQRLVETSYHVAIDWFDTYCPGSSNRIRMGLSLNLEPEELAAWVFTSHTHLVSIDLPGDMAMGG